MVRGVFVADSWWIRGDRFVHAGAGTAPRYSRSAGTVAEICIGSPPFKGDAGLAAARRVPHISATGLPPGGVPDSGSLGIEDTGTMTKLSFGAHPFLLGFDQLERLVERTAKAGTEGYPPYNIEQSSEHGFRITLAVAGFREEDLAITLEDRQLVVRGRQAEDTGERVFLHRGIAARAFQRSFVLAEGVEVAGASMENGLLHVDLKRAVPEPVVQTIRIAPGQGGGGRR
jgi:HSP20 family molecular chaperone IbpA